MIKERRLSLLALMLLALAGCTPAGNSNVNVSHATPSPSASPSASPSEGTVQVTLPLLDALLADDKFVAQLREKASLSADQIEELKRISSSTTSQMRETSAEDEDRDGGDSHTRAEQQLRATLGEDKARQVAKLATDYWSRGDTSEGSDAQSKSLEMLPGPNAVPSDTRVVVNIPAFRMDLFQDGSLVKSYKVGIGYPEFPLPLGLRRAHTIIFNPTWTPPDSPWVADMKNATPGETIQPGDKNNPLGPIKIPIGLPSLIHGGKSTAQIGEFASHGCVGLTTPQIEGFSVLLARASDTEEVTEASVANYLRNEDQTKTVRLSHTVPVELRYETIILEDGKLHIYKDVYAQDTNTEENLRRVLETQDMRLEDLSEAQKTEALNALKEMSANPDSSAADNKKSGKTKKQAKKKNEIVIDLGATMSHKGYPAPVDLDTGSGKKAVAAKRN